MCAFHTLSYSSFSLDIPRYGAVVRGQNAYVPPGARKSGAGPPAADTVAASAKGDVPKVSVNGPDGTSAPAQTQSPPSSKAASPAPPPASGSGSNPNKVNIVFCPTTGR